MALDDPIIAFGTAADLDNWLERNHATSSGIWLKIAKKDSGVESVSYVEALDVALCHGWIDGQKRGLDDTYWLQRFTPRTTRSKWSRANCEKAEALLRRGALRPAGVRQVELAKADGRWEGAYHGMRTAAVPDDLAAAIAATPAAAAFFENLDRRNRYAMIYRVNDAKRDETRRRRIEQFVAMLSEGRKLYP
jgi:uncharacterized protein YdeI (YjbR/CyaY-like superfamily)